MEELVFKLDLKNKINSNGLISILENFINNMKSNIEQTNPICCLEDEDFDMKDTVIKGFALKNNSPKKIFVKVFNFINEDDALKEAEKTLQHLRVIKSYALASGIKNIFNNFKSNNNFNKKEALVNIQNLQKYASSPEELLEIEKSFEIFKNNEDAGLFRLKKIYSKNLNSKNIKIAYTSLVTQAGEGYQLCPKSKYASNTIIPMELSKCRDNCIDSTIDESGKIGCGYQRWLTTAMFKQEDIYKKFNVVMENPKETLLNLREGERTNPDIKEEKIIEALFEENRKEIPDAAIEKLLEDFHNIEENIIEKQLHKKDLKENKKELIEHELENDDEIDKLIEDLLKNTHDKFNEEDYRFLEEEFEKLRKDK